MEDLVSRRAGFGKGRARRCTGWYRKKCGQGLWRLEPPGLLKWDSMELDGKLLGHTNGTDCHMLWKVTTQHVSFLTRPLQSLLLEYHRYSSMPTVQRERNDGELELLSQSLQRTTIMDIAGKSSGCAKNSITFLRKWEWPQSQIQKRLPPPRILSTTAHWNLTQGNHQHHFQTRHCTLVKVYQDSVDQDRGNKPSKRICWRSGAPSGEMPCANQSKWAAEDWQSSSSAEPTVYWEWQG